MVFRRVNMLEKHKNVVTAVEIKKCNLDVRTL